MSRKSKEEYIAVKRKAYKWASRSQRARILEDACDTLGYTRKYVIKLLTGNLRYRAHKGRGRTYDEDVIAVARRIWEAVGCPCTTYLVAEMGRLVPEYEACVALIRPAGIKEALTRLSASTLDRAFRGLPRIRPGFTKGNRRSGLNRPILDAVECRSGEETMACNVPPGDTQVDTVAHCGGDMRDSFFWTLTQSDRRTQWTEITPTWNRGMHSTVAALRRLESRFPFPVTSEHVDNGPEFINYAMAEMQSKRERVSFSRSRPYRKNDNAHVEQKNGSVVRTLLGDARLDCKDLEDDLIRLEREWSDYCNFFRPTKMIVAKTKRADGKGFVRVYEKGGPKTPCERVLESGVLSEEDAMALRARRDALNGIELYRQACNRLRRIKRRQEEWKAGQTARNEAIEAARLADSSLRDAPSGTSASPVCLDGGVDLRPKGPSAKRRKRRSVELLTNQKLRRTSAGALSI